MVCRFWCRLIRTGLPSKRYYSTSSASESECAILALLQVHQGTMCCQVTIHDKNCIVVLHIRTNLRFHKNVAKLCHRRFLVISMMLMCSGEGYPGNSDGTGLGEREMHAAVVASSRTRLPWRHHADSLPGLVFVWELN